MAEIWGADMPKGKSDTKETRKAEKRRQKAEAAAKDKTRRRLQNASDGLELARRSLVKFQKDEDESHAAEVEAVVNELTRAGNFVVLAALKKDVQLKIDKSEKKGGGKKK